MNLICDTFIVRLNIMHMLHNPETGNVNKKKSISIFSFSFF